MEGTEGSSMFFLGPSSADIGKYGATCQASMLEGVKLLLLHHLRDPLSPEQMELLDRHLGPLASYGEKLVQLLHRMRAEAANHGARLKLKDSPPSSGWKQDDMSRLGSK